MYFPRRLSATLLLAAVCWPLPVADRVTAETPASDTVRLFFASMTKLCGQRFDGATEFPANADHPLVGKKLVISVGPCAENEIRIPLQAGEDRSRTWILTLNERGLLLKHDHRHADGSPDKITMYGGWSMPDGSAIRQRFAADPETAALLPEAATNIWTIEIDEAKAQFVYALERNGQPRYRAVFDLKQLAK